MPTIYLEGFEQDGSTRTHLSYDLANLTYQPGAEWFNNPVNNDSPLATPNVFSWSGASLYGRIACDTALRMASIHFHLMVDGTSGQWGLEVWRLRSAAFVRVATATLASGGGDGGFANFSFPDEDSRLCQSGDYFFLQATAKMAGGSVGFVDVHYDRTPLIISTP